MADDDELIRDRYEPIQVLGRGGQGEVLRALDHQHGRWVALKVRPAPDPGQRQALLGEARILLSLRPHPNLPLVRDDFFWNDRYVLVMDWVDGLDLGRVLADTGDPGLPVTGVLGWLEQVADALAHLHAEGVVHGDVKPANLVLTPEGSVVLVDFGVSHRPGHHHQAGMGTPGYTAPELGAGGDVTTAADVYGLAATAVALLSGAPPTEGRPTWEGVPNAAAIERALRRGLASDPSRRPRSATELVERLAAHIALDLPTGVVTFLLTDIEGSTALWEDDPDAMAELLATHDALIADAVERLSGRLLKTRGEGDATFSVFTRASDAAAAAVDAQRAIARDVGLGVRMAVHTGEAQVRDGDYFGRTVNRAARLRSVAGAGQIMLSAAAAELVVDALPPGASLVDRGEQLLRDINRPEHVFQLVHPELPTDPEDPAAAARPSTAPSFPAALAAGRTNSFVGREAETARLADAWRQACDGRRSLALLAGEPGIGKTRLAAEFATSADADGATVRYGRCDEGLGVPYQPFAAALRDAVTEPGAAGRGALGRLAGELVRLVPEVADHVVGVPAPLHSDPETEQYRLFEAIAAWLQASAERAPVVLVLDDLHWATKPTLQMLRHVALGADPARLLIVGTYRDSEVDRAHPLADLLADLRRAPSVDRIALAGLTEAEVVAFLEAAAGHGLGAEGVALALAIHAETEGNPFFVREVLRHCGETGTVVLEPDGWRLARPLDQLGIPEGVREVVTSRLTRLSPQANELLELASVIGPEFDLSVLEAAGALDEDAVLRSLDESLSARLIHEVGPLQYRFAHSLVRSALYDGLSMPRRVRAHGRIATAIERLAGDDAEADVVVLAHHHSLAATGGDGTKAVEYLTRAGDLALARLAHDEAVEFYRRATALLPTTARPVDEQRRCQLLIDLGEAQRRAGDPAHRDTLLEAAAVARRWRDADLLAAAALTNSRHSYSSVGAVDEERVAVLVAALELAGDVETSTRACLLADLAVELSFSPEWERRRSLSDEAVALARRLGDPATLASVLVLRSDAIWHASTLDERLALAEEQAQLAEQLGDLHLALLAAVNGVHTATEAGMLDVADQRLDAAKQLAAELGQPGLRWLVTMQEARREAIAGRLDAAESRALDALELGQRAGQPDAFAAYAAQVFMIRAFQGRLEEIEPLVVQAAADNPDLPGFQAALAQTCVDVGRAQEAQAALDRLAVAQFTDLAHNMTWIIGAAMSASVAARLGDAERAKVLYELLLPFRDQYVADRPTWAGSVHYYLGLLATTLGQPDAADAHFTTAAERHERLGARVLLAMTYVDHAHHLLAGARPEDARRGAQLLREGAALAADLGMQGVLRRTGAIGGWP